MKTFHEHLQEQLQKAHGDGKKLILSYPRLHGRTVAMEQLRRWESIHKGDDKNVQTKST